MSRLAFVGLGAMGGRMVSHLAAADGIDLVVFDLVPERLEALKGRAELASSVADAASGADAIFSVVPADRHVRAVVDEIAKVAKPGQVYVDFSTIGPATIEQVGEQLSSLGVETIAAGMTKSIEGATHGTLSLFLGGVDTVPDALKPAFDALASDLMMVGSLGAAKAIKLVNNMVVATLDIAITEALALGEQYGIGFATVTDAMKANGADNWPLLNHIIPHVLPDDLGPGYFSTRFLIKDLRLYMEFAIQQGLAAVFAGLATAAYRGTAAHGMGDDYHMIVIRWFERGARVGDREVNSVPSGQSEADVVTALVDGVIAVQTLVSAEAIRILGRMGVSAADAAFYLESGSAGNDSLRAMVDLLQSGRPGVAPMELVQSLQGALALAAAAEVPGAVFEIARHLALGQADRYGRESDVWQNAIEGSAVAAG